MKKTTLIWGLLFFFLTGAVAQRERTYKKKENYKSWVHLARNFDDAFFRTEEARRIGENVLLYQQVTGGWPKNIFIPAELTSTEKEKVKEMKENVNESTIDNGATSTEIRYLARLFRATGEKKYKEGVFRGLAYLLEAQYDNGGWPQFYPRPQGYYIEITYNDNAMINVMNLLRMVYEKQTPYEFVNDEICYRARTAFDKGVDCILKTQVKRDGKLTVWCAQHDHETLKPCKARAYELPSLSGQESDNIVLLLMSLPQPSEEIIAAVEGAVAWFRDSRIEGLKKEYFINADGKKDYKMVPCQGCPPLWGRCYDLDINRPFFSDRDGIKKYDISEIGHERRNGYSWYNSDGLKVLKKYEQWKRNL